MQLMVVPDPPAGLTCHGLWQMLFILCLIFWLALCLLQKHALTAVRQAVQNFGLLLADLQTQLAGYTPLAIANSDLC